MIKVKKPNYKWMIAYLICQQQQMISLESQKQSVGTLTPVHIEDIITDRNIQYLSILNKYVQRMEINPIWYTFQTNFNKVKFLQIYQLSIHYAQNVQKIYKTVFLQTDSKYKKQFQRNKTIKQNALQDKLKIREMKKKYKSKQAEKQKQDHINKLTKLKNYKYHLQQTKFILENDNSKLSFREQQLHFNLSSALCSSPQLHCCQPCQHIERHNTQPMMYYHAPMPFSIKTHDKSNPTTMQQRNAMKTQNTESTFYDRQKKKTTRSQTQKKRNTIQSIQPNQQTYTNKSSQKINSSSQVDINDQTGDKVPPLNQHKKQTKKTCEILQSSKQSINSSQKISEADVNSMGNIILKIQSKTHLLPKSSEYIKQSPRKKNNNQLQNEKILKQQKCRQRQKQHKDEKQQQQQYNSQNQQQAHQNKTEKIKVITPIKTQRIIAGQSSPQSSPTKNYLLQSNQGPFKKTPIYKQPSSFLGLNELRLTQHTSKISHLSRNSQDDYSLYPFKKKQYQMHSKHQQQDNNPKPDVNKHQLFKITDSLIVTGQKIKNTRKTFNLVSLYNKKFILISGFDYDKKQMKNSFQMLGSRESSKQFLWSFRQKNKLNLYNSEVSQSQHHSHSDQDVDDLQTIIIPQNSVVFQMSKKNTLKQSTILKRSSLIKRSSVQKQSDNVFTPIRSSILESKPTQNTKESMQQKEGIKTEQKQSLEMLQNNIELKQSITIQQNKIVQQQSVKESQQQKVQTQKINQQENNFQLKLTESHIANESQQLKKSNSISQQNYLKLTQTINLSIIQQRSNESRANTKQSKLKILSLIEDKYKQQLNRSMIHNNVILKQIKTNFKQWLDKSQIQIFESSSLQQLKNQFGSKSKILSSQIDELKKKRQLKKIQIDQIKSGNNSSQENKSRLPSNSVTDKNQFRQLQNKQQPITGSIYVSKQQKQDQNDIIMVSNSKSQKIIQSSLSQKQSKKQKHNPVQKSKYIRSSKKSNDSIVLRSKTSSSIFNIDDQQILITSSKIKQKTNNLEQNQDADDGF